MDEDLLLIRKSKPEDLQVFTDIYNQAIETARCTCDMKFLTVEDRKEWFNEHQSERYPLYACEYDGKVVGYISLSRYKPREALDGLAEVSYYLDFDYCHKGIGTKMLNFALEEAKRIGFTAIVAVVLGGNDASIGLVEKCGFELWGRFPKVCNFNGRLDDHVYYGKYL